jgi:hypothetical protein
MMILHGRDFTCVPYYAYDSCMEEILHMAPILIPMRKTTVSWYAYPNRIHLLQN